MRGTLYRGGPALWEVGDRQLRHYFDGFTAAGRVEFSPSEGGRGGGMGAVTALQRFVDDEPYREARRGRLIADRLVSKRRNRGWMEFFTEIMVGGRPPYTSRPVFLSSEHFASLHGDPPSPTFPPTRL